MRQQIPELKNRTRILFFIGSLGVGGKERRLIELLTFLNEKGGFEILVILTNNEISFQNFYKLDIPFQCLKKNWSKNDPTIFYQLYKTSLSFKPDLIHSWGAVQSFYLLPVVIFQNIPLINGQITDASPRSKISWRNKIINQINFKYSKVILSNSKAGLHCYQAPASKSRVIYNGVNLSRFDKICESSLVKENFQLRTSLIVVMVASFSQNKDYDYFYKIAEMVTRIREDVTFIGVGSHNFKNSSFHRLKEKNKNPRIIFHDVVEDVESLVNACDIGVLFSNTSVHGEGISNAIMEYMSLSKPVIANDAGGTREILQHNVNGFLVRDHSDIEVRDLFLELLANKEKRESFGRAGRKLIENDFSLHAMGNSFIDVYKFALANPPLNYRLSNF